MNNNYKIRINLVHLKHSAPFIDTCLQTNCEPTKITDTLYEVTTTDPVNFFWLGFKWPYEQVTGILSAI